MFGTRTHLALHLQTATTFRHDAFRHGAMGSRRWRPISGIAVLAIFLMWLVGVGPFLLIHLPIVTLAGAAGIWLFYVQHQFEETHWSSGPEWQFAEAALHGSSHYVMPGVLRWMTGNIGIHHVHHLSSRVPCYRLPEVLKDYPELGDVGRITIMESLRCVDLVLWDENRRKLISFLRGQKAGLTRGKSWERYSGRAVDIMESVMAVSTGRDGKANRNVFPVSSPGQRNGRRAPVPSGPRFPSKD